MLYTKYNLRIGDKNEMNWKGKKYKGIIKALNSQEWTKKTGGRFIAIDLETKTGHIIGIPYTSRAKYKILNKKGKI